MGKKKRSSENPSSNVSPARWTLKAEELEPALAVAEFGFQTTAELEPLEEIVGQERALRALDFGLAVRHRGYNIYVSGMTGAGRKELLQRLLEQRSAQEPTPSDWIYVHNFDEPDCPLAIRLASGHGAKLRSAVEEVMKRLQEDLPAALKAKDFDAERERLSKTYGQRSEKLYNDLVERARQLNMAIRRLPNGVLVFIPLKDGKPMEGEQVEKLTDEERADIEKRQQQLGEYAAELMAQQQELSRQLQGDIQEIVRAFARRLLDPMIARIKQDFPDKELVAWLDRIRQHLLENLERLQGASQEAPADVPAAMRMAMQQQDPWLEYRVNVVADNARTEGAPVIVEISPTYKNLFGTIEHDVNLFGRITTNFTHIKPGSLLRANGGYLVFDLEDALTEPLVWKQLKRTLKSGQLLTDVYEPLGLLATTALKPRPIPIDTKVVVTGSTQLFYLLQFYDKDFRELFRIRADFGSETPGSPESRQAYAHFIARQAAKENLPPFDASAVGEIVRFGAREAMHKDKLSVEFGVLADVVREAGHWARHNNGNVVAARDVLQALEERVYRSDRLAAKIRELIEEGTLQITVTGSRVGQVNGLSVISLGDFSFGRPSRVTAAVGIGQEGLINIERESDLSGSFHDKGVLILQGYLKNRYGGKHPIALSASLTFEQSYGWVEGDSASSVELYCLLSALAGVPLRQDVAVTGSVNQHGQVQAVGGVNEKIEGFFDVCKLLGLTGTQGVCMPRANVRHLVLRRDVIEAVREGQFNIWAIETIDEGIELLTGMPAGDLDQEDTFHYLLDQRLQEILTILQEQPAPSAASQVRLAAPSVPKPAPPRLPGEEG